MFLAKLIPKDVLILFMIVILLFYLGLFIYMKLMCYVSIYL